jgi:D-aspartate ligase
MNRAPDAVVIGSGANALGVLRALAQSGLSAVLVSAKAGETATRSRYARPCIVVEPDRLTPEHLSRVLRLSNYQPMLFLTEELDVVRCLDDVDAWRRVFRTCMFTPEIARKLMSKAGFHQLAVEAGAPVPPSWIVADLAGLGAIDPDAFPVVVKPVRRDPAYTARFARAYRLENAEALRSRISQLLEAGVELIVQQWIDGADSDIFFNLVFIDAPGRLATSFVGRKLLCWPPGLGGTAACAAAPAEHEALTRLTGDFLRYAGFRGLIGIEYKRDRNAGRFWMIEPTVYRTDHQHEVAALNGCDLLAQVYRACMGIGDASQPAYYAQRRWVDFPDSRYAAQAAGGDPVNRNVGRRTDAWFRWHDPLPGVLHYACFVGTALRERLRRRSGLAGKTPGETR